MKIVLILNCLATTEKQKQKTMKNNVAYRFLFFNIMYFGYSLPPVYYTIFAELYQLVL